MISLYFLQVCINVSGTFFHIFTFSPLLTLLSQDNVGRIILDGVVDADAWYSG